MPASPVPAYFGLFTDIINDLNEIDESFLDEFTKARRLNELETQALLVKKQKESYGLSLLGSIESIRGNKPKTHEYHKKAMGLEDSPVLALNYISSLIAVKDYDRAVSVAESYIENYPFDDSGPAALADVYFKKGDFEMFWKNAILFEAMSGKLHKYRKEAEMYEDMENDTEESLSAMCVMAFTESFSREINTPEEDAAWANL